MCLIFCRKREILNTNIIVVILEKNHKMCYEEESFKVDNDQYQKFVKKLIYLAHTMSHLTYAISVLSQFMHDPRGMYLQVVDLVLQYLKVTLERGLLFKKSGSLTMKACIDVDYPGSLIGRKSTLDHCTSFGENLVA